MRCFSLLPQEAGIGDNGLNFIIRYQPFIHVCMDVYRGISKQCRGGIRTTTFALVLIFLFTFIRGGRSVKIFHREVYEVDLNKAVTVTFFAIMVVFSSVIILSYLEPYSLDALIFEVTSAFGTVGLSLGLQVT